MIRILISSFFFYLGTAVIIASVIENKYQTSGSSTFKQRRRNIILFSTIGLTIFICGWFIWPESAQFDRPRYYISGVTKSNSATSYFVRINRKLNSEQLGIIIKDIEKDSNKVTIDHIAFFRDGQSYQGKPYAIYQNVKNEDLIKKLVNTFSKKTDGIVYY